MKINFFTSERPDIPAILFLEEEFGSEFYL